MKKINLETLRKRIDMIDYQLLHLLARRLEISMEVAAYKREHNILVRDQKRELEVIKDRIKKLKELGYEDEIFVRRLFELIMQKSREMQK